MSHPQPTMVLHTINVHGNVHFAAQYCNELGLSDHVLQFTGGHPITVVVLRLTLEHKLALQAAGRL